MDNGKRKMENIRGSFIFHFPLSISPLYGLYAIIELTRTQLKSFVENIENRARLNLSKQ